MTLFQNQTQHYIKDISKNLNLPEQITKTAIQLTKLKLHQNTKPVTHAAAIIYVSGIITKQYISPNTLQNWYQYTIERKRGLIPLPQKINKMSIITLTEVFLEKNFQKTKNKTYNLEETKK